jgi:hypothetical protein
MTQMMKIKNTEIGRKHFMINLLLLLLLLFRMRKKLGGEKPEENFFIKKIKMKT